MSDKIKAMRKSLDKFSKAYAEMKSAGVNEDILKAYIQQKTKLSMGLINAILHHQAEFYDKLIVEAVEEAL